MERMMDGRVVECECGQLVALVVSTICPSCGAKVAVFHYDQAYTFDKNGKIVNPLLTKFRFYTFQRIYFDYLCPEEGQHVWVEYEDHGVNMDMLWNDMYLDSRPKPMAWMPLTETGFGV
jgi:hypothetical protein